MKIKDIQLDNRNANKGTARGQKQIVGSIQRNGFGRSGLLDKNGKAIAGNKTTEAAAEVFGVETEPIIVQSDGQRPVYVQRTDLDLDDPDPNNAARRLAYEDNLTSHFSFQLDPDIVMADIEAGFDFEAIDISLPDLGEMLEGAARELLRGNGQVKDAEPQIDKAAQLKEQWGTKLGQVWEMPSQVDGRPHRIVCGDCTDRAVVEAVMRGEKIDLLLTDIPYDVSQGGKFDSYNSGITKAPQLEHFDKGFTPLPFLELFFEIMPKDSNWFIFVGAFHMGVPVYQFLNERFFVCSGWVYVKKFAVHNISGTYAKAYELALYAWNKPHYFDTLEGVESYDYGIFSNNEGGRSYLHATSKPLALFERKIRQLSDKNHIVTDPFLGSGTTLIAAHNLHRIARGIEIDPGYIAVTLERYQDATGIEPRLLSTDSTPH